MKLWGSSGVAASPVKIPRLILSVNLLRVHLCFWWRRGRVELPVQKKLSGTYYKLSRLFYLAPPAPTDRVERGQPVNLSPRSPALPRWHPHFSAPEPDPSGWGQVRWQPVLLGCNHYWFCTCFLPPVLGGSGTSACGPVTHLPCRNHASPLALPYIFYHIFNGF